jgi:hypothetical protein
MRFPTVFDRVARKRKMMSNVALLDSQEWTGIQDAMLFCLATQREQMPLESHERRWIEFRQYVIDGDDLTHESRLVSVTEDTRKGKRRKKRTMTVYAGTGGSIEETVWDLLEQVEYDMRMRRLTRGLPSEPKTSVIEQVTKTHTPTFIVPRGAMCVMMHGAGCPCGNCQHKWGRVPN